MILIWSPLTFFAGRVMKRAASGVQGARDRRAKCMVEVLSEMRTVKARPASLASRAGS